MNRSLELVLRAYKRTLSPLLPHACRFQPTCSEYAAQAIAVHGIFGGSLRALWRLLRCQPFARAGHDPVPPPKTTHRILPSKAS